MFKIEAEWIGNSLSGIDFGDRRIECLNLGSSTREFREKEQSFIAELIFAPLARRANVAHCDMKEADGVDLVGDLADPQFLETLSRRKFDLIICTNLLMHLERPDLVYSVIQECLSTGGYLVLTTPALYPYCGDPIDSKYRPSAEEVVASLPKLKPLKCETLILNDCHFSYLVKNIRPLASFLANVLFPLGGLKKWLRTVSDLKNVFKNYKIACVLMVKNA